MPYCPNPDCSFRKRFGESAEYNSGTAICSDCDTALVADDLLGKAVRQKKQINVHDLFKRLLWTFALLAFWRVLSQFPLPGVDAEFMRRWGAVGDIIGFRISLFSLGLMPYITACVIVEITALLVQPLKHWRSQGGVVGRARLTRTARYLTVVIGVIQGSMLIWQLGNMAEGQFLVDNGLAFKSLLVLTLVAAMFLLIWIADQISAKGAGHGISLLILSGTVGSIPYDLGQTLRFYKGALTSPQFVVPLLTLIGAIVLIVYIERSMRQVPVRYGDGTEARFPFKLTTAGTQPVAWAHSIIALSFFLVPFNQAFDSASRPVSSWIVTNLHQGTFIYAALSAILVIILYFLFTALFFNPREMIGYLRDRNAVMITDGAVDERGLNRSLEGMALIGSLYLVILPLSLQGIWSLLETQFTMVDGISLIVAVCIALDLAGELRFRWRSREIVGIAEFHEPWKAGLFLSLLDKENIPSLVRGYYHRSLLYVFGPYIEMTVYVPVEKAGLAREVEKRYLHPNSQDHS